MKKLNSNIFNNEEQLIAKDLLQTINLNSTKNELTPFLTQVEQQVLKKLIDYNKIAVELTFFGGSSDAERCRAKLVFNDYYDISYDIVCLTAKFNSKFQSVKHKDVLGAIHNIGVNYNRIGDIVVKEDDIYIFVDQVVADYIIMNFSRIGKAVLSFEIIENLDSIHLEKQYEKLEIVSSSHRIDSIVSKITNKSRSKVKEMLQKEFIKLNHTIITNGEKNCNIDDLISIRKYGRYTIKNSVQNKKSMKYRITVDKLV